MIFKGIETILFTTDLSKNCVPAFDVAVILALQFKAKLILLHVIEKLPDYVESRLEGLLGEDHWESMLHAHENEIRQKLIGKRSTNALIKKALEHYCEKFGMGNGSNGQQLREVVIDDGDVAESILENAKTRACDLIVLGDHERHFLARSVRSTIKSVLRRSKIPVMIVPVDPKEKDALQNLSSWSR
jgi:nucleotide-binding universal stress UspA family protein